MHSISATSYKTYYTCPLQWKYTYILKLIQLPNENFIIGLAYHKALEWYYKGFKKEIILDSLKKELMPNKTDEEIKRFGLVRKMFERYIKNPIEGEFIESEYEFRIKIPKIDVPLHGFIDRITKDAIIEYKTSYFDYTMDDIVNNIQTDIYTYAEYKRSGQIKPVIYSVMNKKKVKNLNYKPQILTIKKSKEDLINLEKKCLNFVQDINKGDFKPNPGIHCKWCPYGPNGTKNCKFYH